MISARDTITWPVTNTCRSTSRLWTWRCISKRSWRASRATTSTLGLGAAQQKPRGGGADRQGQRSARQAARIAGAARIFGRVGDSDAAGQVRAFKNFKSFQFIVELVVSVMALIAACFVRRARPLLQFFLNRSRRSRRAPTDMAFAKAVIVEMD